MKGIAMDFPKGINLEQLSMLFPMFQNDNGTVDTDTVKKLYEAVAPKYRPMVKQIPELIGIIAGDLGLVSEALVDSVLEISNGDSMTAARTKLLQQRSKLRFEAYTSYVDAGFAPDMALSIMLADIANAKTARSNAFASMPKPPVKMPARRAA